MKRFLLSSVIASALAIGASPYLFAHEGEHKKDGAEKTSVVVGELIDTACFTASEGGAVGKDHAECAQKCMSTGIPAGVLPEGKKPNDALVLLTNPKPFAPYAAQTIKVEGVVNEHTHVIDVKKAFVKDGENWKEIKLDDEHHKMSGEAEKKDAAKDAPKASRKSDSGHKH